MVHFLDNFSSPRLDYKPAKEVRALQERFMDSRERLKSNLRLSSRNLLLLRKKKRNDCGETTLAAFRLIRFSCDCCSLQQWGGLVVQSSDTQSMIHEHGARACALLLKPSAVWCGPAKRSVAWCGRVSLVCVLTPPGPCVVVKIFFLAFRLTD